jgi:hypothetical protein
VICLSSDLTLGTERTRELEQRAIDQEAEMKRNTAAAAASKAAVSCNCHFSNCHISNCVCHEGVARSNAFEYYESHHSVAIAEAWTDVCVYDI